MRPKTANLNDPMKFVVSPGPGNYNPDPMNKSIAYSMRMKPKDTRSTEFTPGPGQYSLRGDKDLNIPSYK
jgi:hypothetical protein